MTAEPLRLTDREDEIMTFDYCSPAELFTAKRKGGSRQRLGYRRFATAAEPFVSQWKISPRCARSERGCWSVTSAMTAMKSIACMRVMIILWDAERVNHLAVLNSRPGKVL